MGAISVAAIVSASPFDRWSEGGGSGDPDAVFLHDLAVELDAPTDTEVLDDVPVDRRDVRAADGVEAVAEREVDRSVDLFVEVDVPHVAVDAGVAADPELADAARAFVGVECFDQEVLFAAGRRINDAAFREAKTDAPYLAAAPHRGELRERDRALGRRLDRADEELAARHVAGAGVDARAPTGHGQPQICFTADDPDFLRLVEKLRMTRDSLVHTLPV